MLSILTPRHRNREIVPKLLILASRHPVSIVRVVTFWRRDIDLVPKLLVLATAPRIHCKGCQFLASRQALRIHMVPKLLVLAFKAAIAANTR